MRVEPEQLNQLLYGVQLEILEEHGRWAFVRCSDGYLGWAYLPTMSADAMPPATHLVYNGGRSPIPFPGLSRRPPRRPTDEYEARL